MKNVLLSGALMLCCLVTAAEAKTVFLTQESNPQVKGQPLDYCREFAENCGQPAVDAYCRTKGMKGTAKFKVAHDTPPTRVINGSQICNAPGCDRITELTCRGETYPEGTTFSNPQVGGYALDYCQTWAANCGEPAAAAFCQMKGFAKLLNYAVEFDSPPTKVISSGQVCNAPGCDRITKVVCK